MREILFKRYHKSKEGKILQTYWGFMNGYFEGPHIISGYETVCDLPYTGVSDFNHGKIFECDEIIDDRGFKGLIHWNQDDCSFIIKWTSCNKTESLYKNTFKELTGRNIHDKPNTK